MGAIGNDGLDLVLALLLLVPLELLLSDALPFMRGCSRSKKAAAAGAVLAIAAAT